MIKKIVLFCLFSAILLGLFACSGMDGGFIAEGGIDTGGDEDDQESGIQSGQLSAGEWNDNEHYDDFLSLFVFDQETENGFETCRDKGYFDVFNRVDVYVHNEDTPLRGVTVSLLDDDDDVIFQTKTNVHGYAYLFPFESSLEKITTLMITQLDQHYRYDYTYDIENNSLSYDLDLISDHQNVIELMFVIDTTGSMSDELTYLIAEIEDVIDRVVSNNPDVTIYLALLFYRDVQDDYVTRYFDFTTDITLQRSNMSRQSAGGGGDFPEAVDQALDEAVNQQWLGGNTTKIIFHVLDAPPHESQEKMTRYHQAIIKAAQQGIQLIPIASSGIDKWTEYLLRNQAMMTNGTYVFLTNHSGIGNDKIEPTIGEYVPEYLNLLMVRLIHEYHTGERLAKVPYPINEQE